MKKNQIIQPIILFLMIFLFAYTGFSKLLSYDQTRGTLASVKFIGSKATFIAWFIPSLELIAAALLSMGKTRIGGYYLSTGLMVMFTLYVFYILRLSGDVPCTCGGVLQKMNWTQHLFFNIGFTIISAIGLKLEIGSRNKHLNDNLLKTQLT